MTYVLEWAMAPPAIEYEWVGADGETILAAYKATGEKLAGVIGLMGPQGPQGPPGPQGVAGPQGASGAIWKEPVRVGASSNVSIASALENGDTLDGVTLATGDRVLLFAQTVPAENGIYIVAASGAASRASDADTGSEMLGLAVFIREGTQNAGKQLVCVTPGPITVGSTALTFMTISDGAYVDNRLETGLNSRIPRGFGWLPKWVVRDILGNVLIRVTQTKVDHPDINTIRTRVNNLAPGRLLPSWVPKFTVADPNGNAMIKVTPDKIRHKQIDEMAAGLNAIPGERLELLRAPNIKFFRMRDTSLVVQHNIGFFGDSWTFVRGYYSQRLAEYLTSTYGEIGPGWVGFSYRGGGATVGNGAALGSTYVYNANWSDVNFTSTYGSAASPDLGILTSSVVGASPAVVTGPATTTIDSAKLFYRGTGNNDQIRYRWSAVGSWINLTLTGTGHQVATLTPPAAASAWEFKYEVVSGAPAIKGLDLRNTTKSGVCIHKLASTGSALVSQWAPVFGTEFRAGISALGLDVAVIMLGTNDQGENIAPSLFAEKLLLFISELRTAQPGIDILVVMPCENQGARQIRMPFYSAAAKIACRTANVSFYDLQADFGSAANPGEYAFDGTRPMFDTSDPLHPGPTTGGPAIASRLARILTAN